MLSKRLLRILIKHHRCPAKRILKVLISIIDAQPKTPEGLGWRPKIQNQAWLSRSFSSYYFLSKTELFFSFGGNPFFGPGLAGCSLILILRRLLSFVFSRSFNLILVTTYCCCQVPILAVLILRRLISFFAP